MNIDEEEIIDAIMGTKPTKSHDLERKSVNPNGETTYLLYDEKYYKIGRSKNVKKRIQQISCHNPSVTLVMSSDKVGEKYLHKKFANVRLYLPNGRKSEWFDLTEKHLKIIKAVMEDGEYEIGGNTCGGGIQAKLHGLHYYSKLVESNEKWKIIFGKHKSRRLTSMQSPEDIEYCRNYIRAYRYREAWARNYTSSRTFSRFQWWVGRINSGSASISSEDDL